MILQLVIYCNSPGFKYVKGSAAIDGSQSEPLQDNRLLTWDNINIPDGQEIKVTLLLIIGSGASEGEYINKAFVRDTSDSFTISNVAEASVMIIPDPIFDCSDIIGKVVHDKIFDGYQDKGEKGIAGVRLANTYGLLITTDQYGKYHVPCAAVPNEMRGSNYALKVNERTLPSGYFMTSENPRSIRVTRGKMYKMNFGAAIAKKIEVIIEPQLFKNAQEKAILIDKIIAKAKEGKLIIKLTYESIDKTKESKKKVRALIKEIKKSWKLEGKKSSEKIFKQKLIFEIEIIGK